MIPLINCFIFQPNFNRVRLGFCLSLCFSYPLLVAPQERFILVRAAGTRSPAHDLWCKQLCMCVFLSIERLCMRPFFFSSVFIGVLYATVSLYYGRFCMRLSLFLECFVRGRLSIEFLWLCWTVCCCSAVESVECKVTVKYYVCRLYLYAVWNRRAGGRCWKHLVM